MSEAILTPFNDSAPCGTDYKYEDAFLAIEAEIDKSNSMAEGVSTDWNLVLSDAQTLLCEHTKDTKVFCWWAYATWKKEGLVGLEKALISFNTLLETFEDKLFPKSKKVKLSSLTWLEDTLNDEIFDERDALPTSIDAKVFLALFKNLEHNFSLCIKEEVSVFSKLQSALQRLSKEQEVKEEKAQAPKPSTVSTSSDVGEINSEADAAKVLRSLKKNASLLHEYYRTQDAADVKALRLVRLISWIEVDSLPANEEGKTPFHAPSAESLSHIDDLTNEEEYALALEQLEKVICVSPFWLEGHYMAWSLLEKMGHIQAAKEVKNALISFVKMDESILDLSFRDSTPLASIKLKQWLSEGMGAISVANEQDSTDNDKEQILEEANALAKKKQIKEAMALLQGSYARAVNKEDKFHWRLAKAELAVEYGKSEVALALLDELKKDIDKYNLDEWKPELAAKVFSLYLNNFNRAKVGVEPITSAYARLCKLDIAQALEITI